jgi:hypothetical protein
LVTEIKLLGTEIRHLERERLCLETWMLARLDNVDEIKEGLVQQPWNNSHPELFTYME